MTRKQATAVTRAIRNLKGADVRVTRIGTGKSVELMLEGRHAAMIAAQLVDQGFTAGHAFGGESVVR